MMRWYCVSVAVFFFQAEDGIRDLVRSRGLGDVYKRQIPMQWDAASGVWSASGDESWNGKYYLYEVKVFVPVSYTHLTLPTSDLV